MNEYGFIDKGRSKKSNGFGWYVPQMEGGLWSGHNFCQKIPLLFLLLIDVESGN